MNAYKRKAETAMNRATECCVGDRLGSRVIWVNFGFLSKEEFLAPVVFLMYAVVFVRTTAEDLRGEEGRGREKTEMQLMILNFLSKRISFFFFEQSFVAPRL